MKTTILSILFLLLLISCNFLGNKQKEVANSADLTRKSDTLDEWSPKKVPIHIMDYIEIGMNFGYLKKKLGEPDEVNTNDNRYIATWNVENLSITVELKDKTAVKSIRYEDKCVDKHTSYYSYGSWMQDYTFYLGKSTFKTSENDVNFTIEAGMQIEIDYHQKVYGLRGEGFKEYTFEGAADGLSYSDFEGIDLPTTIDKLPKELRQKVVKDAASSVITTFGISEGL